MDRAIVFNLIGIMFCYHQNVLITKIHVHSCLLKEFIIIVTGIPIFLFYLIKNPQITISLAFLKHNSSGIGGVKRKRTKTSCCMNLNYNNAHDGAKLPTAYSVFHNYAFCFLKYVAIVKPIQNSKLPF